MNDNTSYIQGIYSTLSKMTKFNIMDQLSVVPPSSGKTNFLANVAIRSGMTTRKSGFTIHDLETSIYEKCFRSDKKYRKIEYLIEHGKNDRIRKKNLKRRDELIFKILGKFS
jgi:hypothetical protein